MNIAMIGPPGAGKGTHADSIESAYGLAHLSTGMLFREHITNQSALGLIARQYMSEGALVPDEIVDAMIEEWVRKSDPAVGILFDGFPRTQYQAHFLDDLFGILGRTLDGILYFDVSDDVIVARKIVLPDDGPASRALPGIEQSDPHSGRRHVPASGNVRLARR